MKKRFRVPAPKSGILEAKYGRAEAYDEPSVVYVHGGGGSSKSDARLICTWFEGREVETGRHLFGNSGKSFIQELQDRGYDITTLKFSIRKASA